MDKQNETIVSSMFENKPRKSIFKVDNKYEYDAPKFVDFNVIEDIKDDE